jgi:hypothetical protein
VAWASLVQGQAIPLKAIQFISLPNGGEIVLLHQHLSIHPIPA